MIHIPRFPRPMRIPVAQFIRLGRLCMCSTAGHHTIIYEELPHTHRQLPDVKA